MYTKNTTSTCSQFATGSKYKCEFLASIYLFTYLTVLAKDLPTLPETPDVPDRDVDEILSDVLDEGPISNSPHLSPQPPSPEQELQTGLRVRVRRLPQRFNDLLPSNPILLRQYSEADARLQSARDEARRRRQPRPRTEISYEEENPPDEPPIADPIETEPDSMGLYRIYPRPPARDPDEQITIHHVADAPTFFKETSINREENPLVGLGVTARAQSELEIKPFYSPFLNSTVFRLMTWFYKTSIKTLTNLDSLVSEVLLADDYDRDDLIGFSALRESHRLDQSHPQQNAEYVSSRSSSPPPPVSSDLWHQDTVQLPLPLTHEKFNSKSDAPTIKINVHHRNLMEIVKSGAQASSANLFHWKGFKQFWKPSEIERAERVYGEVYTSDAYLELEDNITVEPNCTLETTVLPLMIYSDSTHLANFGTAALWPVYIWFGNLSKYVRAKVTSFSAHHLAYLPSVSMTVNILFGSSYFFFIASGHYPGRLSEYFWHLSTICGDYSPCTRTNPCRLVITP